MKQNKPLLKNPEISCYDLARRAHDCIKWLGGNVSHDILLRESQMVINGVSIKDQKKIAPKIDIIRDKLYEIEKILVKYEL